MIDHNQPPRPNHLKLRKETIHHWRMMPKTFPLRKIIGFLGWLQYHRLWICHDLYSHRCVCEAWEIDQVLWGQRDNHRTVPMPRLIDPSLQFDEVRLPIPGRGASRGSALRTPGFIPSTPSTTVLTWGVSFWAILTIITLQECYWIRQPYSDFC